MGYQDTKGFYTIVFKVAYMKYSSPRDCIAQAVQASGWQMEAGRSFGPIPLIFIQFLGKFDQIIGWRPSFDDVGSLAPPSSLDSRKSWIGHCLRRVYLVNHSKNMRYVSIILLQWLVQ